MKETEKQKETRIVHKWMWMISAIIWLNLARASMITPSYKEWIWLSILGLLVGIYSLAKWYENLHSPQSKVDNQRKEEQEEHNKQMEKYSKPQSSVGDYSNSKALNDILNEVENITPERQEYLLDAEKRMSDDEIAEYMNSKYKK